MKSEAGHAKIYRDRATCRAIQIAEYEQLPVEAQEQFMRPHPEELSELCYCLHCGPTGEPFEAVEMRWMPNEQMWACPCTTCGGRGYQFDIHPLESKWECAECGKRWKPPAGNKKASNCKCPACGCTQANGWFDDEHSQEEIDAMSDAEFEEKMGFRRDEDISNPGEAQMGIELPSADLIGQNIDIFGGPEQTAEADESPGGMEYLARHPREERMPDDIDFPRDM